LESQQKPPRGADAPRGSSEQEELELIARILKGETDGFYELVRPYERRVYVMAYAILQNEADAEEVTQEAILKAYTHLGQFRGESRFSTWLTRVVINESRMRIRKDHAEIMKPLDEAKQAEPDGDYVPQDFADWREIPSEELERKEVREHLMGALAALDKKYREVFVLRDMEQSSIAETAQILGISPGAVKTRLLRARLMLRDLLAPGLGGMWSQGVPVEKGKKPWA
jgi:RNA polymerase sigma-70 factor (ECF subfamily)